MGIIFLYRKKTFRVSRISRLNRMALLIKNLITQEVELMPEQMKNGVLYVSRKYGLAIHLCACGCGIETVTNFRGIEPWELIDDKNGTTLRPSIGNMKFPCGSHYHIEDGKVIQC